MDMIDFLTHDNVPYEFLSEGARPSESRMKTMELPRRYSFGTCTWAIVSLADIPMGLLPAGPTGSFPKSDVAHWDDFYAPSLYGLDFQCSRNLHNVGYAIVGGFWLPNSNAMLETSCLTFTIVNGMPGEITCYLSLWHEINI
ncbi:hypothetical protein N7G274_006538 [Stereocaulon virgatum]|uniref:Uncharacterized protein n=1 Tax=Stereocaulon virgatum TaxID=373712 RepID=A0ABR4A3R6_9LECA